MKISLVIPFFNEADIITSVIEDLRDSLKKYNFKETEILFVDDGSEDKTSDIIRSANLPNSRIIQTQHLGLSHALFIGIKEATGDIIVTIDADGQFSFNDIPHFINALKENDADIVVGYRIKRSDNLLRIISSNVANIIKRIILRDNIIDSTCTLKAFRKEIKDKILYRFDGFHRFIPSFALMNNLKLIQIPIEHRDRIAGKAKFGILNRLPDVIPDVFGVKWLQYKRFSSEADERRYSFYPDLFFWILFIYITAGLFKGYFRVVDDFWLYSSLNRFIGYDYSKSYGWDNFIFNEIVPPLIRLFYAVFMNIGLLLGTKYPLEWANKVIGIMVTFLSYLLLCRFFKLFVKKHYSKWIALIIIFWGVSSSEVYSGLARSFSFILIPLILFYSQRLSVIGLSFITFLTALIYPVLLPLFFITIIIIYLSNRLRDFYKPLLPIILGLIGLIPMVCKIDLMKFAPAVEGDFFLSNNNAFNLPISSDFNLLFGFINNKSIIEWLNFNLLHQWSLNPKLILLIKIYLIIILVLGVVRRFTEKFKSKIDILSFILIISFFIIGTKFKEYIEISYLFKWGILISALFTFLGIIQLEDLKKYKTIFILGISSILAFLITILLSRKIGFGVHEPGRQLQRAFAIILPFASSIFYYHIYKNSDGLKRIFTILVILFTGILFFPKLKLVSPNDKYVIERLQGLPKSSIVLSHPLTANWVVSHTDKYSTIIDEQIRVTKKNPIRGSKETVLPTEMALDILQIYYGDNLNKIYDWCIKSHNAYILVEEYYFSNDFLELRREPYISFIERHNPEKRFALLSIPLELRHPISPESFLIVCDELVSK